MLINYESIPWHAAAGGGNDRRSGRLAIAIAIAIAI